MNKKALVFPILTHFTLVIISPQQTPKEGLVGEHQGQGRRRRRRHRCLHRHHHPGLVEGQQQLQQQQGFLVFNRGRLTFKVVK